MPTKTRKSPPKGSKTRKSPRKDGKAKAAPKASLEVTPMPPLPQTRRWHHGFIIHTRQVHGYRPVKPTLDEISDLQWEMAEETLSQGVVLGFLANPVEAVTAAVAIVERIALPLEMCYEEDNEVLYFAQRQEGPEQR